MHFTDFKRIDFLGDRLNITWCMIFLKLSKRKKKMPEEVKWSQFSYRHAISWPSGGSFSGLTLYNSPSWSFRTSKHCRTFQISLLPMRKPFALKVAFNWNPTFGITQQRHIFMKIKSTYQKCKVVQAKPFLLLKMLPVYTMRSYDLLLSINNTYHKKFQNSL